MITRIIIVIVAASFVAWTADGQMRYSRERKPTPTPTPQPLIPAQKGTPPPRTTPSPSPLATPQQRMMYPQTLPKPTPMQPRIVATPAPTPAKPTPTPVPPPDVKAYVDKQIGNSKDKKFHMTVN